MSRLPRPLLATIHRSIAHCWPRRHARHLRAHLRRDLALLPAHRSAHRSAA